MGRHCLSWADSAYTVYRQNLPVSYRIFYLGEGQTANVSTVS